MAVVATTLSHEEIAALQSKPYPAFARLRADVDEAEARLLARHPELRDVPWTAVVALPSASQMAAAVLRMRSGVNTALGILIGDLEPTSDLAIFCGQTLNMLETAPFELCQFSALCRKLPASACVGCHEQAGLLLFPFVECAAAAITRARSVLGTCPSAAVAQLLGLEADVFACRESVLPNERYHSDVEYCLAHVLCNVLGVAHTCATLSLGQAFVFMSTLVLRLMYALGPPHRADARLLRGCLPILMLPDFRCKHAAWDAHERVALAKALHAFSLSWYHGEPLTRRLPVRRGDAVPLLDALERRIRLIRREGVLPTPFYLLAHDMYVTLVCCATPRPAAAPGHNLASARAVASQAQALHRAAADTKPLPFSIVHCLVTAGADASGDALLRVASSLGPTADRALADAIRAMVPHNPRRALIISKLARALFEDSAALADALRICYERGQRRDAVDPPAALALARRAHPCIQARYLFHGIGCAPDPPQALGILSDLGTCCATTALGQLHGDMGDRHRERRHYARAAARGCVVALWRLAHCLPDDIADAPTARVRLYHAAYARKCAATGLYVDATNEPRMCLCCGAATRRRCGGCMKVFLCGPPCHAAARTAHRTTCSLLAGELAEQARCSAEIPDNPCDGKWPDDVGDIVTLASGSDLSEMD